MLMHDMPMDAYRKWDGVSASDLKNIGRSPAYAKLRPSISTESLEFGTAVHTAVLEPEQLVKRYRLDPMSPKGGYPAGWRNTNDYKTQRGQLLAETGVLGLMTAAEFDGLSQIAENVARNEIGAKLHDLGGTRESSLFVNDGDVRRKCRPDWLIPAARMIVDVKTAQDWRAQAFSRACLRYSYHLSAAYYIDTFELYETVEVEHYVFLVVASDAPYEVASYTLDRDSIEKGRKEYRIALREWARCSKSDEWPGGSAKIEEIRIPEFSINYHMDREDEF
mgnify:FL=1